MVFVPRTAPGDVVVAGVGFAEGARFGRGLLKEVEAPSPRRVEPPCAHYVEDRCGGCQLQHLALDAQREAKGDVVRDALVRIGKRDVEAPAVRGGELAWRYRRKLTLDLRAEGEGWVMGLHPYDRPADVFQLRDCPITDERVMAAWREIMAAGSLLPRASRLRVAVRWLARGAAVVVEGGLEWPKIIVSRFVRQVPRCVALWWVPEGGARRLVHDARGDADPGASFVQVNAEVAALLHAHVVDRALSYEPRTVVDGYAGAGSTAIPLAERGVAVTAIELDADATAWSAARLPAPSRAVAARVEEALEEALPADLVLLNPPRAGLDERVTSVLANAAERPRAIIYVSCNPATLARDVARLPGWRVAGLTSFDMFPQTAHVETVCELVPEAA